MTDLIYDYITQGVDLMICAAILSSVTVLLYANTQMQSAVALQQAYREEMRYYTQFNQYDNTTIKGTSVISGSIHLEDTTKVLIVYRTHGGNSPRVLFYDLYGSKSTGVQSKLPSGLNGYTSVANFGRTQSALIGSNTTPDGINTSKNFSAYLDTTSGAVDCIVFIQQDDSGNNIVFTGQTPDSIIAACKQIWN